MKKGWPVKAPLCNEPAARHHNAMMRHQLPPIRLTHSAGQHVSKMDARCTPSCRTPAMLLPQQTYYCVAGCRRGGQFPKRPGPSKRSKATKKGCLTCALSRSAISVFACFHTVCTNASSSLIRPAYNAGAGSPSRRCFHPGAEAEGIRAQVRNQQARRGASYRRLATTQGAARERTARGQG